MSIITDIFRPGLSFHEAMRAEREAVHERGLVMGDAPALVGPAADFQRDAGDARRGVVDVYAAGGATSGAGFRITEEGSLALTAVFASVRVLSESVAQLPLKVYRRDGRSRVPVSDHPVARLFAKRGNPLMSAMKLREVAMVHLCLWGNFFAEKVRDGRGDVVELWPIHPARVVVKVVKVGGRPELAFEIDGPSTVLTADDVFFVAGLGTSMLGKSPIQLHREGLGTAFAAQRYGARFFASDARPGMVLTHPAQLSDEAYDRLKREWNAEHQGASNAHKLAILEEGMKPETVGLPPEDAQFIETRKFERGEVASLFRVPPHMIGDLEHATFANIEHQSIEFVVHSLGPWLVRFEQAADTQLLSRADQGTHYAKHLVGGLLRGDTTARYDAYTKARNWGWFSANDIRELEDLNPIDGGDVYLQPLNMVPAGADAADVTAGRSHRRLGAAETRALPNRYQSALALEPLFQRAIARVVRREVRAIRDAVEQFLTADTPDLDGFGAWLRSFADEHTDWAAEQMLPVVQAMADEMVTAARGEISADLKDDALDQFVRDYTAALAKRHVGSTRGQVFDIVNESAAPAADVEARLDAWEGEGDGPARADSDARRERQRSSNALTLAAWILVGVSTATWRAIGKSCPFCDALDGEKRTTGRAFMRAGDTLDGGEDQAPLEASYDVGHPPVHDGCDCIMMPGGGARMLPTSAEIRTAFDAILRSASAETRTCRHAPDRAAKPAARSYVQRRNAHIQSAYQREIATRYGEREVIIEELRRGEFEGAAYQLAPSTTRKICDNGNA